MWARKRDTEHEMRTIIPVFGGGDGGESRGLRSRVGRMKNLLWLRPSQCVDVHMDTEPGVWLTSFQSLDTDGQYEVSWNPGSLNPKLSMRDSPVVFLCCSLL